MTTHGSFPSLNGPNSPVFSVVVVAAGVAGVLASVGAPGVSVVGPSDSMSEKSKGSSSLDVALLAAPMMGVRSTCLWVKPPLRRMVCFPASRDLTSLRQVFQLWIHGLRNIYSYIFVIWWFGLTFLIQWVLWATRNLPRWRSRRCCGSLWLIFP